ncbi:MOSC domain-containing protein YiiM [Sphaerotilus hippei]|uniref:MOSC domain-containing protein YiiM n=2 Tax=Sphaerotilus hippei TaxID=744406 RepID=A0A318H180_9BURK|nr:MOSC domain-containing protein YiiM [Sphaerotilus hippei]
MGTRGSCRRVVRPGSYSPMTRAARVYHRALPIRNLPTMSSSPPVVRQIVSINVGTARPLLAQGRRVLSAIGKRPVDGPVEVRALGLAGDEQADLSVHGGLSKAVYAYPAEHAAFWQRARAEAGAGLFDEPLPPGRFGENLTLRGLLETELWIGDRLVFPDCVLVVSEPRQPCFKFNAVMGFAHAAKVMAESGFCGCYLSVEQAGTLQAGQAFELVPGARQRSLPEVFLPKARRITRDD